MVHALIIKYVGKVGGLGLQYVRLSVYFRYI